MTVQKALFVGLVVCALCVPAWASTIYKNDTGNPTDTSMTNWQSSELLWLNQFVAGVDNQIVQLSVAIPESPADLSYAPPGSAGNYIPGGTVLTLALFSDPNQDGDPTDAVLLASNTVTIPVNSADRVNNGFNSWYSVNIPATTVTGKFFVGVKFFARECVDNANPYDAPSLDYTGTTAGPQSWVLFKAQNDPSAIDLSNLSVIPNIARFDAFGLGNAANMIEATGVPEPATMTLLLAGMGLGLLKRRKA